MPGTLILGIGNILLRDEGVGVRVVEAMQQIPLPGGVEILDGGTSGVDLVDEVAGRDKLIVIDAVKTHLAPGTVLRFGLDKLVAKVDDMVSLHEFGLVETLNAAKCLGCMPRQVVIFGVAPADTSPGLTLSDTVASVLSKVIRLALAEAGNKARTADRQSMDCSGL
jgi:hydrogenase maturation protease